MGLTKEQYDRIMQDYAAAQDRNRHEQMRRRHLVYAKIPEYQKLEEEIPSLGVESLRVAIGLSPEEAREKLQSLRDAIRKRTDRKRQLLLENGFPEDFLEPRYDCPDCHDTGYIDGKKCHCLKKREVEVLYDQSNLKKLIQTNNFSLMSDVYYEGESKQLFHKAVALSRAFIRNFDEHYENLYFYGTVGTGKSFLSICIAKELLDSGHSVLYFSAAGLFELLSSYAFGRKPREDFASFLDELYSSDLLIIDDLGTELTNGFVKTQLFECINERHIRSRSTIISTNLSLRELQGVYSDRIFSRITSNYMVCKLTGPDIRVLKKVRK